MNVFSDLRGVDFLVRSCSTKEDAAAKHAETEAELLQTQELNNLVQGQQYEEAFKLALKLQRVR